MCHLLSKPGETRRRKVTGLRDGQASYARRTAQVPFLHLSVPPGDRHRYGGTLLKRPSFPPHPVTAPLAGGGHSIRRPLCLRMTAYYHGISVMKRKERNKHEKNDPSDPLSGPPPALRRPVPGHRLGRGAREPVRNRRDPLRGHRLQGSRLRGGDGPHNGHARPG